MDETETFVGKKMVEIGPDRLILSKKEVVIEAKHPMPDWQVRELNPPPIYIRDKKYFLVEARRARGDYKMRYLLHPWTDDMRSNAKGFFSYDAEAVTERDSARRAGQKDELIRLLLLPFYPVLGLFWSGTQKRLMRFGFMPHAISGISIFLVFCLCFCQGVFAVVTIHASLRSQNLLVGGMLRALSSQNTLHLGPVSIPLVLLDGILTLAFMADILIRYNYYLHEHEWFGGFLEWVFRRKQAHREPITD